MRTRLIVLAAGLLATVGGAACSSDKGPGPNGDTAVPFVTTAPNATNETTPTTVSGQPSNSSNGGSSTPTGSVANSPGNATTTNP